MNNTWAIHDKYMSNTNVNYMIKTKCNQKPLIYMLLKCHEQIWIHIFTCYHLHVIYSASLCTILAKGPA